MNTGWGCRTRKPERLRIPGLILSVVAAAAFLGCPGSGRVARPTTRPEPAAPAKVDAEMPPPEVASSPPPPSEADMVHRAAAEAQSRGDDETARDMLAGWAAGAQTDRSGLGETHYRLGMLYADPNSSVRNADLARREFHELLDLAPEHVRAAEAEVMLGLLGELDDLRARSTVLNNELDELKGVKAALTADLEKKDQELKSIKQVLLQKKP